MLCGIRISDQVKVIARDSEKVNGPYLCPKCKKELVLKKGNIKIHHFAHKPPFNCGWGTGETEAHRKCKESIFLSLKARQNVSHTDLEVDFGNVVADVYAIINKVPIAIEIQKSKLSVNEITRRTQEYHKLKINVLWISLFNSKLKDDRYSPSAWEKWCHATYFGRVYYWENDLILVPIHFSDYQLYVEPSSWYESGGNERSAGGYYKTSKRYKTPKAGEKVDVAINFNTTTIYTTN